MTPRNVEEYLAYKTNIIKFVDNNKRILNSN